MKHLLHSIALLLACVSLGWSLECYFGNPADNILRDTQEPGPGQLQDDEGLPLLTCTKNITILGDITTGLWGGLTTKVEEECKKEGHLEWCFCNTDKCNAAETSATLLLPLLILPALITQFL